MSSRSIPDDRKDEAHLTDAGEEGATTGRRPTRARGRNARPQEKMRAASADSTESEAPERAPAAAGRRGGVPKSGQRSPKRSRSGERSSVSPRVSGGEEGEAAAAPQDEVARLLAGHSLDLSSSGSSDDDDEPRLSLAKLLDIRGSSPTAKAMARWCPALRSVSGRAAAHKVRSAAGQRTLLTEKECAAFAEGYWAKIDFLHFSPAGKDNKYE
jgi:hypothetical protein